MGDEMRQATSCRGRASGAAGLSRGCRRVPCCTTRANRFSTGRNKRNGTTPCDTRAAVATFPPRSRRKESPTASQWCGQPRRRPVRATAPRAAQRQRESRRFEVVSHAVPSAGLFAGRVIGGQQPANRLTEAVQPFEFAPVRGWRQAVTAAPFRRLLERTQRVGPFRIVECVDEEPHDIERPGGSVGLGVHR